MSPFELKVISMVITMILTAVVVKVVCSHWPKKKQFPHHPEGWKPTRSARHEWIHARRTREHWEMYHTGGFTFHHPQYQYLWEMELGAERFLYLQTGKDEPDSSWTMYCLLRENAPPQWQ